MTNDERAQKLFAEANKVYKEMKSALLAKSWNLCVRRAQEVVELLLKGILYQMGVDYPKVHDIAPLFIRSLQERGIKGNKAFLDWLLLFSLDLARKRAPAFYFEEDYGENDAREAYQGAKKVMRFAKRLYKRIGTSQPAGAGGGGA